MAASLNDAYGIRAAMANSVEVSVNQVTARLMRGLAESTARTLRLAGRNLQNIVELLKDEATNPAEIGRINQVIADSMIAATVTAYEANVVGVRSAPSYRSEDRFAGKLLEALKSPSMAVGTAEGIAFIDVALLDATARHWARLNFGAGPAVGRVGTFAKPYARLRFGSNQGVTLKLTNPPRPNFSVPQRGYGHFNGSGQFFLGNPKGGVGRDKGFIVTSGKPSKTGIAGRHFLDYGLVALAQNFKPAYITHFQDAAIAAGGSERNKVIKG